MTGTLGLFSLVDLFQLLSSSARTGRLVVDHPTGPAKVYFERGHVAHAEFGPHDGEEAVFALFRDERGTFEFSLGLPPPRTSIGVSTENLLLEAMRRVDEANRDDGAAVPDVAPDAVLGFPEDVPDAAHLTLRPQEVAVLRLVDGTRDVKAIALSTGMPIDEARDVVSRLLRVGAIVVRNKRPRVARLVAQLTRERLPLGSVAVDSTIVDTWTRVLGGTPTRVACKRPDGRIEAYALEPRRGAGPYILFSRETLLANDLAVETTLLVKPQHEGA